MPRRVPVRTGEPVDVASVLAELQSLARPDQLAGMARYGINPRNRLGVSIPNLRSIARRLGKDHTLAEQLWSTGIEDARILAAFVDVPSLVDEAQMERWAREFDSWDVCDQVCCNLFDRTPHAVKKAVEWAGREEEFVRRAGFVLMAALAVHDSRRSDDDFLALLPVIAAGATDERNFVKKAVSWALRQIGKRNPLLRSAAIDIATELAASPSRAARWVGKDARRDLERSIARASAT